MSLTIDIDCITRNWAFHTTVIPNISIRGIWLLKQFCRQNLFSLDTDSSYAGGCLVAFGRDVKQSSISGRATQYLIGCITILILLGLLIVYWPAAFAIAGVIVWWSRKSSHVRVAEATTSSDQLAVNSPQATQLSSSMPKFTPSLPTPVITIEYSINRSVARSATPGANAVQWASYNDQLEVASYLIEHPMTYWASGKTRIAEASCIEKHLTVSKAISDPIGVLQVQVYWS